jgi:ribulose-bisphosphate carboxylase large chain
MRRGERLALSGERLRATYRIAGGVAAARAAAAEICVEQTVEFPPELIAREDIRGEVIGRVEAVREAGAGSCEAIVSFAAEVAGGELTQLLNVLDGNTSLKAGVRLVDVELPAGVLARRRGPRFGAGGVRALLGAGDRPLLCSALKPMGLSPKELAEIAYELVVGGIDLVKDDHGLADQPFCPYEERVSLCAAAVARANRETGGRALYAPNATAPADRLLERALYAKEAGAGGLLVAPGLVGFDAMRALADDDRIGLPILCHPALLGAAAGADAGIACGVLYGLFARLAGADATIFPSFGGRFGFTEAECRDVVERCRGPLGRLAPILPVPAGGMTLARIPELKVFYGDHAVFLIGGDLHRGPEALAERCRRFLGLVSG